MAWKPNMSPLGLESLKVVDPEKPNDLNLRRLVGCTGNEERRVPSKLAGEKSTTLTKRARLGVCCLVDGCKEDLSKLREYHRRHKVCETHSKTPIVLVAGQQRRFCQQCSRFHSLVEFDEAKRSCRKRLDSHNRRRRKPPSETINSSVLYFNYQGSQFSSYHPLFPTAPSAPPHWTPFLRSKNAAFYTQINNQLPPRSFSRGETLLSFSGYEDEKRFPFETTSTCFPHPKPSILPEDPKIDKIFSSEGGFLNNPVLGSECALSLLSILTKDLGVNSNQSSLLQFGETGQMSNSLASNNSVSSGGQVGNFLVSGEEQEQTEPLSHFIPWQ